jgi:membrane protein implicated in regulation of membrane protease activity
VSVDWPLAIGLGVIFVVVTALRWRKFRRRMREKR